MDNHWDAQQAGALGIRRELGLFSQEKTKLREGNLFSISKYLTSHYREDQAKPYSEAHRERDRATATSCNKGNSEQIWGVKEITMRWWSKCCNRLFREAGQPQTLEIFKTRLDTVLSNLTWLWSCPCSELEVDESASTGLFQPTLYYSSKSKLKWKISRWSDWKREEEEGMGMGTVQVV